MARARRKGKSRRGGVRRVIFIIPFVLILSLAFIYKLRETPPGEKPDRPLVDPSTPVEEKKKAGHSSFPRLALIIDDGGYDMEKFKKMLGMGKPVTFAILPNTPHGREAAFMAHQDGSEVMLHLPMEPKEGELFPLEKDTLLIGMSPKEIQSILLDDLKQIPYVRGINNHMGSKATEDPKVMQALMASLKKEKLYFIDSHTSPQSLGPEIARQAGVATWQNDKFIDHEKDLDAIKEAIRLAMRKAKKEGKALAIGHPHPLTARAIREMIPEIEKEGIRLVFASEIVG